MTVTPFSAETTDHSSILQVKIAVSKDSVSLMQGSRNQTGAISQEKAELLVMNSSGVTLPNTGGPGVGLLYLLGGVLTAFAGAGLLLREKLKI